LSILQGVWEYVNLKSMDKDIVLGEYTLNASLDIKMEVKDGQNS